MQGARPPVTVWCPTNADDEAHQAIGPFDIAAPGAAIAPGRYLLIVTSHGSAARPSCSTNWPVAFVNAVVDRGGAHPCARQLAGHVGYRSAESWRSRLREMSAVIDWLLGDAAWAASVDPARIGAYGMSAGGSPC
ncbi:MAG: hypothetical protein R3E68_15970 [Burkholderiaceae bacterium]